MGLHYTAPHQRTVKQPVRSPVLDVARLLTSLDYLPLERLHPLDSSHGRQSILQGNLCLGQLHIPNPRCVICFIMDSQYGGGAGHPLHVHHALKASCGGVFLWCVSKH